MAGVGGHPLVEERDAGAGVMGDEREIREAVEHAAVDQAGHRDHGVERPAEHLGDVQPLKIHLGIGPAGIEVEMDPDRLVLPVHVLEDRYQRRIVQEFPVGVGVDENAFHPEPPEAALRLLAGGLDVVHGDRADRDETVGIRVRHVEDRVVRRDGELRRDLRIGSRLLERGDGVRDDLLVDLGVVQMLDAQARVPERRHRRPRRGGAGATSETRHAGGAADQALHDLGVRPRAHVAEGIDLHRVDSSPRVVPGRE